MQLYYELQTLATKYPKFGSIFEIINMSFLSSLEPLLILHSNLNSMKLNVYKLKAYLKMVFDVVKIYF